MTGSCRSIIVRFKRLINSKVAKTQQLSNWMEIPTLFTRWPYNGLVLVFGLIFAARSSVSGSFACNEVFHGGGWPSEEDRHLSFELYELLLCGSASLDFSLRRSERIIMWILSVLGIFGNVIPTYVKNNGAKRHISQIKGNRVLLLHIVSGILTVLGNGLVGIFGGFDDRALVFWFLALSDLVHQLSIILLLKNHDGIYPLRTGNLTSGIFKFTVLINHALHGPYISDIFFTLSFGFMGTRLATVLSYMTLKVAGPQRNFKYEAWYSLALSLAQFHIMLRVPSVEKVYLLMMPVTSLLFYHELWNKKWKPHFVLFNCIFAFVALASLKTPAARHVSIACWYFVSFFLPRFYRWPENALKNKEVARSSIDIELLRKSSIFD